MLTGKFKCLLSIWKHNIYNFWNGSKVWSKLSIGKYVENRHIFYFRRNVWENWQNLTISKPYTLWSNKSISRKLVSSHRDVCCSTVFNSKTKTWKKRQPDNSLKSIRHDGEETWTQDIDTHLFFILNPCAIILHMHISFTIKNSNLIFKNLNWFKVFIKCLLYITDSAREEWRKWEFRFDFLTSRSS